MKIERTRVDKPGPYCVYKLSFSSGKSYFGITKAGLKNRIRQHKGDARRGSSLLVHRAIRKHNFQFDVEVIHSGIDKESAVACEKSMIFIFSTMIMNGYNMTPGGELPHCKKWTSKDRDVWLESHNFKPFYMYEQSSKQIKGPFNSIVEFCNHYKASPSLVSRCLNGKSSSHKGMIFYRDGDSLDTKLAKCKKTYNREFYAEDQKGTILGTWTSIKSCCSSLRLGNARDVRAVLDSPNRKSHKGYFFKYKE